MPILQNVFAVPLQTWSNPRKVGICMFSAETFLIPAAGNYPSAFTMDKAHHDPTIQGCFLQGIKAQRAPPAHPHRILLPQGPRGHCPSHSHHRLQRGTGQELLQVGMCLQGEDRASQEFKQQHKGTVHKNFHPKSLSRQGKQH